LRISYAKSPQRYKTDLVQEFFDYTRVTPGTCTRSRHRSPTRQSCTGRTDRTPEDYAEPDDYIDDLSMFMPAEQKMIMRDNLRACLLGLPVARTSGDPCGTAASARIPPASRSPRCREDAAG
jgi:hypothetical protein